MGFWTESGQNPMQEQRQLKIEVRLELSMPNNPLNTSRIFVFTQKLIYVLSLISAKPQRSKKQVTQTEEGNGAEIGKSLTNKKFYVSHAHKYYETSIAHISKNTWVLKKQIICFILSGNLYAKNNIILKLSCGISAKDSTRMFG